MNLKYSFVVLLTSLIFIPSGKGAETIFLYKGTFSRKIEIEELHKFKNSKIPTKKLKNLIKITNQKESNLLEVLSYEIDLPLKTSSKLMNSKIGKVFLTRISKIIHPNKIMIKSVGVKALRSGILLGSFKNNEKINLIDFFSAYPNKNIAINLNALNKTLKKVKSLNELIKFYSDSPLKKLKDGSSSI